MCRITELSHLRLSASKKKYRIKYVWLQTAIMILVIKRLSSDYKPAFRGEIISFGDCDKFIEDSCQGHTTVRYGDAAAVSKVKHSQHHIATPETIIHLELCCLPSSGDGK
jgi:hypothetical protein